MCAQPVAAMCGLNGGNYFGGEGKYGGQSLGICGNNIPARESRLALTSPISYGPYAGLQQPYIGLPARYEHIQRQQQPELSPLGTYVSTDVLDNFSALNIISSPDGYASSGILSGNSPTEADAHVAWMLDSGMRRDFAVDFNYNSFNGNLSNVYNSANDGFSNCRSCYNKSNVAGEYSEESTTTTGMLLNDPFTKISSLYKTGSNYGQIGSYPKSGYSVWECNSSSSNSNNNQNIGNKCSLDAITHYPNISDGFGNVSGGTLLSRASVGSMATSTTSSTSPNTAISLCAPVSKCVSDFDNLISKDLKTISTNTKASSTATNTSKSSNNGTSCGISSSLSSNITERSTTEADLLKFILPSGPRKTGEGVTDENQGILETKVINGNSVLMQITLLVSGFIIGPSGETIRAIITKSGASIYSFSDQINGKKCRLFYIDGSLSAICHAIEIIEAAIHLYKRLAEGLCNGVQVEKKQRILGVDFVYQPPPKHRVPYAAGLKVPLRCGKFERTSKSQVGGNSSNSSNTSNSSVQKQHT